MSFPTELAAFLLLAIAGSAHCAGMCGGFAVVVAARGRQTRSACGHLAAYGLGKTASYLIVGFAASLGAQALTRAHMHQVRWVLAWGVGLALVFAGVRYARTAGVTRPSDSNRATRLIGRFFAAVRGIPGTAGSVGIGLATGLLPCGLSWSAILLASQSSPPTAVVGLSLFGLATTPALAAVGLGAHRLPARWKSPARRLVAPLLIGLGAWTALRGVPPDSSLTHLRPECCGGSPTSATVDEVGEHVTLSDKTDDLGSVENR